MGEWRALRGWSEQALRVHLARISHLDRNFEGSHENRLVHPAWETHRSRSRIGAVAPGPPRKDGAFARGRAALESYGFSDPAIVQAHFDSSVPLGGRRMLLEIKVYFLRYLCGVVVGAVREEEADGRSVFGFRYDTLEGHIEAGSQWLIIEKDYGSGTITFEIEATWQLGDFPNWWSKVGFRIIGKRRQKRWHVLAHHRMSAFLDGWPLMQRLDERALAAHRGLEIRFDEPEPTRFGVAGGSAASGSPLDVGGGG